MELAHEKQPWCLGVITRELYEIAEDHDSFTGMMRVGKKVLDMTKLEPLSPSARTFVKADRNWPVFDEDVRMIDIELVDKTRGRSADQRTRLELPAETMRTINSVMYQ